MSASELARRLDSRPDWNVGGPPCQGFSTVGKRERHDPRNQMFLEFVRLVRTLRPEGFLLENVQGLRDMRFARDVSTAFEALGYSVTWQVLRAADFGVPQLRRRVVFVGNLHGRFFHGPPASHGPATWVNVSDAIGDLPVVLPGETRTEHISPPLTEYQSEMRADSNVLQGHTASNHPDYLVRAISYIPDGGNRSSIPPELQPKSGFHNSYSRLNSQQPAVAVTSNMSKPSASRCIHPFQNRGLTAREGARLQSFPDSFHFHGGNVSQRLQIANAVPPRLGKALGSALASNASWLDCPPEPTLPEVNAG